MVEFYRIAELRALAQDGAVVILKIDGERKDCPDIFTVVLSGGRLCSDDFFRMDGSDISTLIDSVINFYKAHSLR
jgi:hypothetical protein